MILHSTQSFTVDVLLLAQHVTICRASYLKK